MNIIWNIVQANRMAVVITLLSAILATLGIIARTNVHQAAVVEQALKPIPQPPTVTDKQIEETAQKPIRPRLLP